MEPVSSSQQTWPVKLGPRLQAKNLSGSRSHEKVGNERNHREQQQQVNEAAGYVKNQEAASPQNEQQQRNY